MRITFSLLLLSLSVIFINATSDIPPEWLRQISNYDAFYSENDDGTINSEGYPGIYLPLMGNGYFSHSKGVRSDTYFIAGVYNNETTSPSIRARIPATFAIQIENSETTGTLLDIRNGTYYRRGLLLDYKDTWYELRWYAHMSRRNLYVMELQVFSNIDVTLKLSNNPGEPTDAINFHQKQFKAFTTQCGNTTIPETSDVPTTRVCIVNTNIPDMMTISAEDSGKIFTFITAVRTSLDSNDPDTHVMVDYEAAVNLQKQNMQSIFTTTPLPQPTTLSPLLREHILAWDQLWSSGVELDSNRPDACMAVNASLYAILSSVRDDWAFGLAPGGLTNYYSGHSFWDTETWMYPSLLLLHPSTARSLLDYRYNRLDGAYSKAKTYTPPYSGAMFPWESAFTGVETCPTWADTGLREQHISADISLAVWQYWSVTRDHTWLRTIAWPILQGVADFIFSRVSIENTIDNTIVAHIYDVIPPDEYVSHGNDSIYTNYGAASALRYAVLAAIELNMTISDTINTYTKIADALLLLYDPILNIHPEYQDYTGDTIKQADVVLLHYPWNMDMTKDVRRNDLEYYAQRSDSNGPAMTWGMHSIGYKDLLLFTEASQYFNRSFQGNMHQPFYIWSETPSGNAGNFITGAGGFLQTLTHGYAGLRVTDTALQINSPACLEGTKQLKLRNISYLGAIFSLSYECIGTITTSASSSTALRHAADSTCVTIAHTLRVELVQGGKLPLQLVEIDSSTGVVVGTYTLVQGRSTVVPVSCVAGVEVQFAIQAAVSTIKW